MNSFMKGSIAVGRRLAVSVLPSPLLFSALLLLSVSWSGHANPIPTVSENWREPCGGNTTTHNNFTELMAELMSVVGEDASAAGALKTLLTAVNDSRVSQDTVADLESVDTHVLNFPHALPPPLLSQTNVSQYLTEQYVVKAKMYIFIQQARLNAEACDTRIDKASLLTHMDVLLVRLQSTLCLVSRYLQASGQPMPDDLIPSKLEVLTNSKPPMLEIPGLCINDQDTRFRSIADYIMARDTHDVMSQLYERYLELHSALANSSQ